MWLLTASFFWLLPAQDDAFTSRLAATPNGAHGLLLPLDDPREDTPYDDLREDAPYNNRRRDDRPKLLIDHRAELRVSVLFMHLFTKRPSRGLLRNPVSGVRGSQK